MVGLVVGDVPTVEPGDVAAFSKWAKARLLDTFPCDTVTVDGEDVGFWIAFASAPDAERWEVFVAWRQPPAEDDVPEDGPRPPDTPRGATFVTSEDDIAAEVAAVVEDDGTQYDASFVAIVLAMRRLCECLADDETGDPVDSDEMLRMLWLLARLPAGWSDPTRFLARPGARPEALDRDGTYADAAREVARSHFAKEIGGFLDKLDREAFWAVFRHVDDSLAAWPDLSNLFADDTWRGLDSTFVEGAPLATAMEAYPGLVDLLCQAWRVDEGLFPRSGAPDVTGLLKAVTKGPVPRVPVAAAVARMEAHGWRVPDRTGTWAVPAVLPFRLPGRKERATPSTAAILALAAYAEDTVPRSDDAWKAFDDVWPTVALADATLRDGIAPGPFAGLDAAGGWEAVRSAISATIGGGSAWDSVLLVPAMVDALRDQVLLPARDLSGPGLARSARHATAARETASALARHILLSGRNLADILSDYRAWTNAEVAYPADKGAYESVLEAWRPLLPVTYRDMDMAGFAELVDGPAKPSDDGPSTLGERLKGVGTSLGGLFRKR